MDRCILELWEKVEFLRRAVLIDGLSRGKEYADDPDLNFAVRDEYVLCTRGLSVGGSKYGTFV